MIQIVVADEEGGQGIDRYATTTGETGRRTKKNTTTGRRFVLGCVGLFMLVAVGIGVAFFLFANDDSNQEDASGSADEEDTYATSPSFGEISCPVERQKTQVCQEVYGMTYCGEARSMGECHATCVKSVRSHLGSSFVCQPEDSASSSIMAYIQDDPTHWTRETPSPISRREIMRRGATWLKHRVRYSQRRYHSEVTVSEGKRFRTDCTGYLSMAWGIPQIGTTSWVRSMKDTPGEGVTNHNKIFESIPCSTLRPGDAMVNTGHIVLFRRWTNRTSGNFDVWEEKGTVYGTIESAKAFVEEYSSHSDEKGFRTTDSSSTYYCLRRKNLVADEDEDDGDQRPDDGDDSQPDDGEEDDNENDIFPGFNSACSLRPEMTARIVGESGRSAGIWNAYGGYLQTRANELGVNVEDLVAVLQIESGGKGFDKTTGKPILRFENHVFKRMLETLGAYDQDLFDKHFRFDSNQGWLGHTYRGGSLGSPTGEWRTFHGDQTRENDVLALAASWNAEAAYRSASYGLPQIMGFNYGMMNHASAMEMYESFAASIERQLDGLLAFLSASVKSCSGLHTDSVAAIEHLRTSPPDYVKFACNYNGGGQKEYYGGRIEDAATVFRSYERTSVQPATGSSTSCSVDGISGFCVDDALCDGRSEPGYCPGASNIKCCIGCGRR